MTNHRHLKIERLYKTLMRGVSENGGVVCEQVPQALFPDKDGFSMLHAEIQLAKNICGECPLIVACAEYAIEAKEEYGIWGGMTPTERTSILKRGERTKRTYLG